MKRILTVLLASALLLGCASVRAEAERGDLGFSALREIYEPGENALVSPLSLKLALSMAALGAQGHTREQIDAWLDARTLSSGYAELSEALSGAGATLANGAFVHPDIALSGEYSSLLTERFQAGLFALPTGEAKDAVNAWVSEKTNGMIPELLREEPDDDARLILLNALALDAKWETPFEAYRTSEGVFHGANGDETARFLYNGEMRLLCGETGEGRWARLPYADGSLSMYVLLPGEGGMEAALGALAEGGAGYLLNGERAEANVAMTLPRFSLSASASLKEALAALGMTDMFDDDADFTPMTGADELMVGEVLQSVRIDVDEEGTRAAAATEVEMLAKSAYIPDVVEFTADRPFLLAILDETSGETLFAACVETLAD